MNVGSEHEPRQLEQAARITRKASEYRVPVLAMAYARGPSVDEHDPDSLAHAVRLAEELGADIAKTAYSGDAESFEDVTGATDIPVIMAGGSPRGDRKMLENVRDAIDAGAAGVSMGRSIFQHDDPEAMTQAVSEIVHRDVSVDTAFDRANL
jgi:fructose-bisphosphate aldolase/2-amino-3,7-dideoxy-D-threo-hept-6-ulosonate synthase